MLSSYHEFTFALKFSHDSTYNADFDGDEMNVHLPQDEVSRAEAFGIVDANKQCIVPTSGDPIRGLIQVRNFNLPVVFIYYICRSCFLNV